MKPCCIYSYYGALLKAIHASKHEEYAAGMWMVFVKSLRYQWDASYNFPLYMILPYTHRQQLEKTGKYCSTTYKRIQFLIRAEYIHAKLKTLEEAVEKGWVKKDKKDVEEEKEEEEEKDEVFVDAQDSAAKEGYETYTSQEKLV